MANLNNLKFGDIVKFDNGCTGIVSYGYGVDEEMRHGNRCVYLLTKVDGEFFGELADGLMTWIESDSFSVIGNITDLLREWKQLTNI
jgi:hypothetical protein